MTRDELIEKLQAIPNNVDVFRQVCGGCHECNPEGITYYDSVESVYYDSNSVDGFRKPSRLVITL